MKNILLIILFVQITVGYAQEKEVANLKFIEKSEAAYESKSYLKLYKISQKGLVQYSNDKRLNYLNAVGLFYSKDNKKIQKKISEEALWESIFGSLIKSRGVEDFDKSFEKKLQRTMVKTFSKLLESDQFEKAKTNLDLFFVYYDHSKERYNCINTQEIQDDLFVLAIKKQKENSFEAKEIFDWMHKTFYYSKIPNKYVGYAGYSNEEYHFEEYANPIYTIANTAQHEAYLTPLEKEVIYIQNIARVNPVLFAETYLEKYVQLKSLSKSGNIKSLIDDLKSWDKRQYLYSDKALFDAAEYHALDMGNSGGYGHDSSDGTSFSDRMNKFVDKGYRGENCSYKKNEALDIVMQLLIDEGVPSLGHRKNIMNEKFSHIGVAFRPHKIWGVNTVLDYME